MRAAIAILVASTVLFSCAEPPQNDPNRMTAPMTAAEVAREIELTKAVTPLPPGASWKPINLDPVAQYGPLSGQAMVEFQALCAWLIEAAAARDAGDQAALRDARAVLGTVSNWRSFSDPGTTARDTRDLVLRVVRSAQGDDPTDAESFTKANCAG